jgi:hypothetical protein
MQRSSNGGDQNQQPPDDAGSAEPPTPTHKQPVEKPNAEDRCEGQPRERHRERRLFGFPLLDVLQTGFDGLLLFTAIVGGCFVSEQIELTKRQMADAQEAGIGQQRATIRALRIAEDQAGALRDLVPATTSAADAAQSAAVTAHDTLVSSRKSFQVEQRPYVVTLIPQFVSLLAAGEKATANVSHKNIGKTPAVGVYVDSYLLPYNAANKSRDDFRVWIASTYVPLWRGEAIPRHGRKDVAPDDVRFTTASTKEALSGEDVAKITSTGEIIIFYVGIITYSDAYKGRYSTEFCWMFWGNDPKTWRICDSHNVVR